MSDNDDFDLGDLLTQNPVVPPSGITSSVQFFEDYLSILFKRELMENVSIRWCCDWQDHMEAEVVIEALWRSWEVLRLNQETGMAVFMRDFAYPLMGRLFDPLGTFCRCTIKGHDPDGIVPLNHHPLT